ncbi:hypothetical protein E4T56_gene20188 [Termitomyces sp. T112]|nr:hypothetical protein E4T56_gene20188 [Termitomyces sp. T112]
MFLHVNQKRLSKFPGLNEYLTIENLDDLIVCSRSHDIHHLLEVALLQNYDKCLAHFYACTILTLLLVLSITSYTPHDLL